MITFYDLPSSLPTNAWSPNPWKTRYSLNYKGLEYKTEWVEFPDIEALSKKLNITPMLPAIYDSSTGVAVSDSIEIAKYLDKAYPDTPKLLPEGTEGFHYAFVSAFDSAISLIWKFVLPTVAMYLNPESDEYFTRTRTAMFGSNPRDLAPKGEAREKAWGEYRKGMLTVGKWLANNGGKGTHIMGETICFADFVIAGHLLFLKLSWGEESPEWKDIRSWDDGRWAKLVDEFKRYDAIH